MKNYSSIVNEALIKKHHEGPNPITVESYNELHDTIVESFNNKIWDLNYINVSKITSLDYLFIDAIRDVNKKYGINVFDDMQYLDVSRWNVSNVNSMEHTFYKLQKFNGDISKWDVSNVKNCDGMFYGCSKFNSDISKWNTKSVETMYGMFKDCIEFNQDIGNWNVTKCYDFTECFNNCASFDQDLSNWDISERNRVGEMFKGCKTLFKKIPKNIINCRFT